ncbi:MAG: aspartate/glutamate racemase family protein, partial [Bacteroidales bacterium]|nr:aspartate/glutamate racemase family protein [Bacteroidales bacterium]
ERAESIVHDSIKPLLDEGADRIVLGCTHYPFLAETILKVASEIAPDRKLEVIDPAPAVARHLVEVMKEEGLLEKDRVPGFEISLYSSGDDRILKETYETLI